MIDLQKRHLEEAERRLLHQPKSDFIQTPKGEECRNSASLVITDLVESIIKSRPKHKSITKKQLTPQPRLRPVAMPAGNLEPADRIFGLIGVNLNAPRISIDNNNTTF